MKSHNFHSKKQMSVEEAAYVAGFIDGEGTIGIIRETRKEALAGFRYTAYFSVCSTDMNVLEAIRSMMGNGRIISTHHKKAKPHHKDVFKLTLSPNQIRDVVPKILPYLIIKREQALLVLEFLDIKQGTNNYTNNNMEKQHSFWQKARFLNQRGKNQISILFGGLRPVVRPEMPTCSFEGCTRKHYGKGLCRKHYKWVIESKTYKMIGRPNCAICNKPVPEDRPISARYCSRECKRKANYLAWQKRQTNKS